MFKSLRRIDPRVLQADRSASVFPWLPLLFSFRVSMVPTVVLLPCFTVLLLDVNWRCFTLVAETLKIQPSEGMNGKLWWLEMYEENSDRIESDSVIHLTFP